MEKIIREMNVQYITHFISSYINGSNHLCNTRPYIRAWPITPEGALNKKMSPYLKNKQKGLKIAKKNRLKY